MDALKTYEKLKALNSRAFNLSQDDKDFIKYVSSELKIPFVARKNCKDCFKDQIIILCMALKKQLQPIENSNCDFVVIGDLDVNIRGVRINNQTLTNDLANWLINTFKNHAKYIKRKEA